jgi:hypothetical protein
VCGDPCVGIRETERRLLKFEWTKCFDFSTWDLGLEPGQEGQQLMLIKTLQLFYYCGYFLVSFEVILEL